LNETLKVLVVEDSRDDAELVLLELKRAGYAVASARVASGEGMKAALAGGTWDLVLSDYRMPGFSGIDALRILEATGLELPFVLVSGAIGEEEAVAAMKAGAHGFVAKHNLSRLGLVVERELKDAKARKARRQAEEELARNLVALAADHTVIIVTHSPVLLSVCRNSVVLDRTKILTAGPTPEVLARVFPHQAGGPRPVLAASKAEAS